METTQFKTEIKQLKNQLRGKILQVVSSHSTFPHKTLQSFGNAILNEEKKGNSLYVSQIFTSEGTQSVTSLSQLAQLFLIKTITGIQFRTYSMRSENATHNLGSLD